MLVPGHIYDLEATEVTRTMVADDVIFRLGAPGANGIVYILEMWAAVHGTVGLNETNAIEIVRLSGGGAGGAAVTTTEREPNQPAYTGTNACIDANDWSTPPTVTDVLGGARSFNLDHGWHWSWTKSGSVITVKPNINFGFRVVRAYEGAYITNMGMTIASSDI